MELEVKRTIWVDLDDIIKEHNLNKDSTTKDIYFAVGREVEGWDDYEYYLIGDEELKAICDEIAKKLRNEPTAKDWEDFWNSL